MPIQTLIDHFNGYVPLTPMEIESVIQKTTERKVKKRQYILQAGDLCNHYNFIVSGCLKMYSIDNSGKEHNLQFGIENNWLTDIGSLHDRKPSKLFIEAIEPSTILQIELRDLVYLYKNHPKFNLIFRVITENNFVELQNRVLQNISNSAEERYAFFLTQHPSLSHRLPSTQIASFLGITPEFLSTIKKSMAAK